MKPPTTVKAIVDGSHEFDLQAADIEHLDIIPQPDGSYHIIRGQKTYAARLISKDLDSKTLLLDINGTLHEVCFKDSYDLLVEKMGLNLSGSSKMNELKAPMPGLVLDILVANGQAVEKGTPMLVLEAMKMENIIKATGEGVVKQIMVEQGQAVEKNQVLLELE